MGGIHRPRSTAELEESRRRIAYEELLLLNLARERPPIVLEMEWLALENFRLERGTMTLGSLDLESPSVTVLRDANFATQFQGAEMIAENQPDFVLLLPWNLENEVLAQEQAFPTRAASSSFPSRASRSSSVEASMKRNARGVA